MSTGWENYDPAPIEKFHGEAMEEFHAGAEHKVNEVTLDDPVFGGKCRYVNGIEFNRLLARFKVKVMNEYGITSDPIPKNNSTDDSHRTKNASAAEGE